PGRRRSPERRHGNHLDAFRRPAVDRQLRIRTRGHLQLEPFDVNHEAEGVGFEPTVTLPSQWFSRACVIHYPRRFYLGFSVVGLQVIQDHPAYIPRTTSDALLRMEGVHWPRWPGYPLAAPWNLRATVRFGGCEL